MHQLLVVLGCGWEGMVNACFYPLVHYLNYLALHVCTHACVCVLLTCIGTVRAVCVGACVCLCCACRHACV